MVRWEYTAGAAPANGGGPTRQDGTNGENAASIRYFTISENMHGLPLTVHVPWFEGENGELTDRGGIV